MKNQIAKLIQKKIGIKAFNPLSFSLKGGIIFLLPMAGIAIIVVCIFVAAFIWFMYDEADKLSDEAGVCINVNATGTIQGKKVTTTITSDAGASAKNLKGTIDANNKFNIETKNDTKSDDVTTKKYDISTIKRKYLKTYTWENWYINWASGTGQRKMYDSGNWAPDKCGIMKYKNKDGTEDYMVALGSYFGSKMGTRYKISFSGGQVITAVLADQKADAHTGKSVDTSGLHRYAKGGVLEFLVNQSNLNATIRRSGDASQCSEKQYPIRPYITSISGINAKTEVKLEGTIKNKKITFKGTIDGNDVTITGTIKDGKFEATGQYGEGCSLGGEYLWPVPGITTVTGKFGEDRGDHKHAGIDIPFNSAVNIVAVESGEVIEVGKNKTSGNYIMIRNIDNYLVRYQHLESTSVSKNDNVTAGDKIGTMGYTGYCIPSGPGGRHLHIEIWKPGSWTGKGCYAAYSKKVNPLKFLKK